MILVETVARALPRNIKISGQRFGKREVDSIFIGGGTPTSVDAKYINSVIRCIRENFDVLQDCEITIEANPATVDRAKLDIYKQCGINRISMGVQSAVDSELGDLSRIHSFSEFKKSFLL